MAIATGTEADTRLGAIVARLGRPVPSRPHVGGGSSRMGLAFLAVALVLVFEWRSGNFLTYGNFTAILVNTSSILLVSIAVARLLVAGALDLSLAGMYALISVVTAIVARDTGSAALAVAIALAFGAALGATNGMLVRLLGITPIIVTLGLAAIYGGVALVATDARSVSDLPASFVELGRSEILTIPTPVVVSIALFIAGALVLTRTVGGLRSYAIGGNAAGSRLAGVDVDRHRLWLFVYVGMSMGAVAVLTTSRLGSGSPTIGAEFEIDVLTAVILGGVAFSGGAGRPVGVFVGVVTIGILNAGMIFVGLSDFYQQIAKGAVLLGALGADQLLTLRRGRRAPVDRRARVVASSAERHERRRAEPPVGGRAALAAENLERSYGAVVAVEDVSLQARCGEVLCLVGDNGAGKSTVIRMLSGVERPDRGVIRLHGVPVLLDSPADARANGIETVYQDLALCPNLGAAYNLALGREPSRVRLRSLSPLDRRAAVADAEQRLGELGSDVDDVLRPVSQLSGGQRQAVAISRVVGAGVDVVILDEPTAALGVTQTSSVLRLVRALADRGAAVIIVTHDVESVLQVSDRVVVLDLGRVLFAGPTATLSEGDLVHLMAGLALERPRVEV